MKSIALAKTTRVSISIDRFNALKLCTEESLPKLGFSVEVRLAWSHEHRKVYSLYLINTMSPRAGEGAVFSLESELDTPHWNGVFGINAAVKTQTNLG